MYIVLSIGIHQVYTFVHRYTVLSMSYGRSCREVSVRQSKIAVPRVMSTVLLQLGLRLSLTFFYVPLPVEMSTFATRISRGLSTRVSRLVWYQAGIGKI